MKEESSFGNIIQIGDILVSTDVVTEFFACDYPACHGQCCVVGDSGAPMLQGEDESLERGYEAYSGYMTPQGREAVAENGFFEIDREGDMVTLVVRKEHKIKGLDYITGTREVVGIRGLEPCAYITYQYTGGVPECMCSVEKCFFEGKCDFRKPISCRLYPIRVQRFPGGGTALNYHRWNICSDAIAKGRREGTKVYQFLREPICDAFGEEFWQALDAAARYLSQS